MKLLSIPLMLLIAGTNFKNTHASQMSLATPKNIGIIAACGAAIGSGVYYLMKWHKIKNAERALFEAAKTGDLAGINDALNAGANIDAFGSKPEDTALKLAVAHQQIPAIKALLANGAFTEFHPKDVRSSMYAAVFNTNNEEIFKIFVKHSERTQQLMRLHARDNSELIAKIDAAIDSE